MLASKTIETIKSTVPLLEQHGQTITTVFYEKLFAEHPYLKNIFNMANQGKGKQSRALSDAVIAYAKHIDNVEVLLPTVQRIANKHASLGIQAKHYNVVGENLLAAIQQVLSLPDEHVALSAWHEAYTVLAEVFIAAERELYQQNQEQEGGWAGFREFYIERVVQETPQVKSIYLKPIDLEAISSYQGGQYVGVKLRPDDCEYSQIRQYSLSQFLNDGALRISVKAENSGLVSNYLHRCQAGDAVQLQAPTGVFTLKDRTKKHVFIAGGVGITPLMSMLQQAIAEGVAADDLLFIQCAKDESQQIFADEFTTLVAEQKLQHKRCFENTAVGDHQGYLDIEVLRTWMQQQDITTDNAQVYFCGPKSFMAVLKQFFIRIGFAETDIHYEVFGPTSEL